MQEDQFVHQKNCQLVKFLTLNDLICLRPSGGLEPGLEQSLIGKKLKNNKEFGDQIHFDDLGN